jgi:hypothetical protein
MDENEDLIARMEDLIEENDNLKQQLNIRVSSSGFPDGRYKSTPVSQNRQRRQHWEDLDERETSTQATMRNRSSGQRSVRSNASRGADEQRYYEPQVDEDSSGGAGAGFNSDSGVEAPLRVSQSGLRKSAYATRKSSGNSSSSVAFDNAGDQVIAVPVTGNMRSSRSRVATPFVSGEAVDKLVGGSSKQPVPSQTTGDESQDIDDGKHSQVNFETNVSVVEVPLNESDEPGHHSRSVRGRIATPFIHDIPQKSGNTDDPPEDSQKPFPPPPE